VVKIDFARALLESNQPDGPTCEAVRNLEQAAQTESGASTCGACWRQAMPAQPSRYDLAGTRRDGDHRGNARAQSHAAAARQLQQATPAWQRAQDIKAYINSRPPQELNLSGATCVPSS